MPPKTEAVLRVVEALQQDVSYGRARLDGQTRVELGLSPGDIIEIRGSKTTAAVVWRSHPGDEGKGIIHIDNLTRKNAGVGIGDKVTIRRAQVRPAKVVTLAPAISEDQQIQFGEGIETLAKRGLLKRPVVEGDIVVVPNIALFGNALPFSIVSSTPKGIVLINEESKIIVREEAAPTEVMEGATVSYEDIGGLREELQNVREMIELPLKHPELFERLGIDPPKGVLLHGTPGTGKTLIAKAVANEAGANFYTINGPEIMSKFYGQSLDGREEILVVEDGMLRRRPIARVVADERATHVPAFDENGNVVYGEVKGFFRHKRRSPVMRIRTATGRSLRVTADHSLFTLTPKGITDVPTKALVPGQSYIAIPTALPTVPSPLQALDLIKVLGKDDRGLVVRGPYVEACLKDAFDAIGRDTAAEVLGVRTKYTYDLISKHVGVRLAGFLALMKRAGLDVDASKIELATKGKGLAAQLALTPELCEFFGWWLAEGSYTSKDEVRLSLHANELEAVRALVEPLFGAVTVHRKTPQSADIIICSTVLGRVMKALGFKSGARNKRVPDFVFNLSKNNIGRLLRGYISGDGSVNASTPAPQIEVSTESPALADDVCHLLLVFGIVPKVYGRPGRSQRRIMFADAKNLGRFQAIGFASQEKNRLVASYVEEGHQSRRDRIPLAAVRELLGPNAHAWKELDAIGVEAFSGRVSLIPPALRAALTADVGWDRVEAIEELDEQPEFVYDISVQPGENFIAGGGVFAHNSEENLRKTFEEAEKNHPAIVFIDEIDAIAPKRDEVQGEVERRVVSQMLTLMDGLKGRGRVIVIGATNRPDSIDPALRRPGRFDREIEIGVPDRQGRLEVLQIHTRNMPKSDDFDLEQLAESTYGFVGADLAALAREAAMRALRRYLPEIDLDRPIPTEVLEKMHVSMNDFKEALKIIEPSALREFMVEIPKTTWDDVGGMADIKQQLKEAVEWPLKYPAAFESLGIRPPRGILLYGPPGTGKTLLARAVANESGANFLSVKGPEVLSKWVGESEKAVREIFKKAKQAAPAIVFLDELDSIAPRRGMYEGSHVTESVVNQLLTSVDGLESLEGVVIIGATNRPDIIDPGLLRAGRFDRLILAPAPDEKALLEILKVHTRKMPLAKDVALEDLVPLMKGYVGSDVESLCREAAMLALREDINAKKVKKSHFDKAIKSVRASVTEEIIKYYAKISEQLGQSFARKRQVASQEGMEVY
jgi:SpoVK/Ycf46/Vps4 family AAA+-type ATPase/intein/homing endonuclease